MQTKEEILEVKKKWRRNNKDRCRKYYKRKLEKIKSNPEKYKEFLRKQKEWYKKYISKNGYFRKPNVRFQKYKSNAYRKNLEFSLSKEEFGNLLNGNCCYCGTNEKIGIDRIDNTLGYIIGNCVSCCSLCNKMKTNLNREVFLEQCKKITNLVNN